ncbi:MAG: ribonuclease III [Gemmatimonadetes bacterium]|nr:MAG: ribonuclease III [Gemmatimonadota bacterium]
MVYLFNRLITWFKTRFLSTSTTVTPAIRYLHNKAALAEFQQIIGYRFKNPGWLQQALQHRSYLHDENSGGLESNERMEFLGDAVLELVVNDYLFHHYPNESEGNLTKIKGLVVSKPILAERGADIHLPDYLLMGVSSGGEISPSVIADAYEALLCAIYLDGGLKAARAFLAQHFLPQINKIIRDKQHANYKSALQEYIQGRYKSHPVYQVVQVEGPDHQQTFTVNVLVEKQVIGSGQGRSKKEAQQEAARVALLKLGLRYE